MARLSRRTLKYMGKANKSNAQTLQALQNTERQFIEIQQVILQAIAYAEL